MVKKRDMTDEEKALWKEALQDVIPIKPSRKIKKDLSSKPVARIHKKLPPFDPLATAGALMPKPQIDPQTRQKIASGAYKIDGRIDLHGFTLDNAYEALSRFLAEQHYRGSRMVLVITGKGRLGEGGLQSDVPRWLSLATMANMVAYHTIAQPRHGGAGALYVYLRRKH